MEPLVCPCERCQHGLSHSVAIGQDATWNGDTIRLAEGDIPIETLRHILDATTVDRHGPTADIREEWRP